MNFGERIVYWYLRLNGFFPLPNFVLHQIDRRKSADSDLLALRMPHTFEEIGGQHDDWDRRWAQWNVPLCEKIVGLHVEVKTGSRVPPEDLKRAFADNRLRRAIQRLGMFCCNDYTIDQLVSQLNGHRFAVNGEFCVGKLVVSSRKVESSEWLALSLHEAEQFIQTRMACYRTRKLADRMLFPDELIQYFAWKGGVNL